MGLFEKLFGTSSERAVKQIMPIVKAVNELEPRMEKLSDEELRSLTAKYKESLQMANLWMICWLKPLLQ